MGLRRQVHEGVRAKVEQQPAQPLGVANVHHLKAMVGAPCHCGEIGPVAGVGELVDGEHLIAPHPDQMAHQGRTDEASAASNNDFHAVPYPLLILKPEHPQDGNIDCFNSLVANAA